MDVCTKAQGVCISLGGRFVSGGGLHTFSRSFSFSFSFLLWPPPSLLTVEDAVELVDDAAGEAVAPLPPAPPEPETAAAAFFCASVAAFSCFS